ncbi:MAG: O-antigen ligase domain-containing protein [Parabacteroides sp.]|nr:O-antigen ligase domain-containing protein [Parabacteroides sp.]
MVQEFINKQFYNLFVFSLIFGLVLYGPIGFDGIDEVCALLLLLLFTYGIFKSPEWSVNKSFITTIGIFVFYIGYSIFIHSNSTKAILKDVVIQFKPYLGFFAVYYLRPVFTLEQKKLLQGIILVIWGILVGIGVLSLANINIITLTVGHVSYYAGIITSIALLYLFCSNYTHKEKIIFILILATGLFSGRSKFYGFLILSIVLLLFFESLHQFKFNLKTITIALSSLGIIIAASWKKFVMYFGAGQSLDAISEDYTARAMLYITSLEIFRDYFPFGSGFASFASYSSGVYYSSIYKKYNIDGITGITKRDYPYIADTYYPCLAQFGVVGVILYMSFFIYITRKAYQLFRKTQKEKYFTIPFMIIGYLLIENVADATFTGHRGFFVMMLLGLVLSEQKKQITTAKEE